MRILTIMDYSPQDANAILMCRVWLERIIACGRRDVEVLVLYNENRPNFVDAYRERIDIAIEQRPRLKKLGPHADYFLTFKLPAIANTPAPFIYIDADAYPLVSLEPLWSIRNDKPWIATIAQRVQSNPDTLGAPFVSAGVQIVSDSSFYSFDRIHEAFKADGYRLRYPGLDQAALTVFAQANGYDYTHPGFGTEWNSYAGISELKLEDGVWRGTTRGLAQNHPVYIHHYWCEKPWVTGCPMHQYFIEHLARLS